MNQSNKNNTVEENLRDTNHNKKAKKVFLKLLAKQKKPKNPFDKVRSQTYPLQKTKPGADNV